MSPNRWKRAFVMPLLVFQVVVLVHSLWRTWTTGLAPVWIGPLVVAAAFLGFMGWMIASGAARTGALLPGLLVVSGGGALLALAGAAFGSTPGVALPVAYALLALCGQLLYVFWYSRLGVGLGADEGDLRPARLERLVLLRELTNLRHAQGAPVPAIEEQHGGAAE